jgi:hypothetical protein
MIYEIQSLIAHSRRSPILSLGAFIITTFIVYTVSDYILKDDTVALAYIAMIFAGGAAIVVILNNWRNGLYFFLGWLMFEDLARKYLGNNMAIVFGKDLLLIVVYLSFFLASRRKETQSFRPPFLVPLAIFFWFGVMQVFNPGSPHFVYGLMGMKIYFLYVPLMLIGYSLVETEEDVRRFFKFFLGIAVIVAGLGIVQAVLGHTFLNPAVLQEDIRNLSLNYRRTSSGLSLYRPNSVFVSTGRLTFYLLPAWLMAFGFAGYLILRRRSRTTFLLALGALVTCTLAVVMGGSRGAVLWTLGSAIVAAVAFLWGAPWRSGQLIRVFRVVPSLLIGGAIVMSLMIAFYPEAVASRLEFYSETLLPSGTQNEVIFRAQEYPLRNFLAVFDYPRWDIGYGIGTFSLGIQYVARIFKVPQAGAGTESGWGSLVLELGIAGLILWFIMITAIVVTTFKVAIKLRGTAWFPIGFVIMWYAFLLLVPESFAGLAAYQDYVLNAHLWLLLGILFRLPDIPFSAKFNLNSASGGLPAFNEAS